MNTSLLIRYGRGAAIVLSVAVLAGCAHGLHRSSSAGHAPDRQDTRISSECRLQSTCNYNGQYEPGERDFAEQEARRLNQAQVQRLRRGAFR